MNLILVLVVVLCVVCLAFGQTCEDYSKDKAKCLSSSEDGVNCASCTSAAAGTNCMQETSAKTLPSSVFQCTYQTAKTTVSGVVDPRAYIYTHEIMGAYNLTSCSGALSCGSAMSSFNGVSAKSNGYDQCTGSCCGGSVTTGCAYQCVELAQRYFNTKFGIIPNWHDNANMMCSNYPAGVKKTSNPQPGDLWVTNAGTYGHVAVITAVHSSTVDVIEQNSSPTGKNTYKKADASCFLTAQGSAPAGSCSHLGYYCGNDGLGLDANNLYYCSGTGATPSLSAGTDCSFTCATMPSGQDDKCTSGSCSSVSTGNYCGSDKIGGDKNMLFRCESGKPAGAKYCSNGCTTAPSGYNDYCN